MPKPTDNTIALMSMLAVSTGSITADLQDVPNVPIRFMVYSILFIVRSNKSITSITIKQNDPTNQTRNDNAALAWTWKAFLDNQSNPAVLMHLPMTKVY